MAKEVADFNVRVLYVSLGGFNTNMPNAVRVGSVPLDPDYVGKTTEKILSMMGSGEFQPDGDREKAVRAIYEVVVGEGIGVGREAERVLPLGRDLAKRIQEIVDGWRHTMDVFGEVCNNVYKQ